MRYESHLNSRGMRYGALDIFELIGNDLGTGSRDLNLLYLFLGWCLLVSFGVVCARKSDRKKLVCVRRNEKGMIMQDKNAMIEDWDVV